MKYIKLITSTQHHKNDIVDLVLNRPDIRNAFNAEMISEITEALNAVAQNQDVRLVKISGEGKSFCAGADLTWMQEMVKYDYLKNLQDAERLNEMFLKLYNLPVPVITLVQGHAMGGALGLIAASDIVLAEKQTEFAFSEVRLGIAPAVISPYVLQKIGFSMASRYLVSGESFNAQRALEMGLVHEICDINHQKELLQKISDHILNMAPQAARETKKLLRQISPLKFDKNIFDITTDLIARLRVSDEGQIGLKSFLNKQNPPWRSK